MRPGSTKNPVENRPGVTRERDPQVVTFFCWPLNVQVSNEIDHVRLNRTGGAERVSFSANLCGKAVLESPVTEVKGRVKGHVTGTWPWDVRGKITLEFAQSPGCPAGIAEIQIL